jgi:hypothetical protein
MESAKGKSEIFLYDDDDLVSEDPIVKKVSKKRSKKQVEKPKKRSKKEKISWDSVKLEKGYKIVSTSNYILFQQVQLDDDDTLDKSDNIECIGVDVGKKHLAFTALSYNNAKELYVSNLLLLRIDPEALCKEVKKKKVKDITLHEWWDKMYQFLENDSALSFWKRCYKFRIELQFDVILQ